MICRAIRRDAFEIEKSRHLQWCRKTQTVSNFADAQNAVENTNLEQTDLAAGPQTELRSLRDALWEAINGIETKAPGALIERELMILDRVAEKLGNIVQNPKV